MVDTVYPVKHDFYKLINRHFLTASMHGQNGVFVYYTSDILYSYVKVQSEAQLDQLKTECTRPVYLCIINTGRTV